MLGFSIRILRNSCAEKDTDQKGQGILLATWKTGLDGLDWLENLVTEGKAKMTHDGGYPCRYVARLSDVLPLIKEGIIIPKKKSLWVLGGDEGEEYLQSPGWIGKVTLFCENIDACHPDESVTIDAWDQS